MVAAPLPDLDSLDVEAMKALVMREREQRLEALAAQHETLQQLHAELDEHRRTLSVRSEELRTSSEWIEHLKLLVDKLLQSRLYGCRGRYATCPTLPGANERVALI